MVKAVKSISNKHNGGLFAGFKNGIIKSDISENKSEEHRNSSIANKISLGNAIARPDSDVTLCQSDDNRQLQSLGHTDSGKKAHIGMQVSFWQLRKIKQIFYMEILKAGLYLILIYYLFFKLLYNQ